MSESTSQVVTHHVQLAAQGDRAAAAWLWERYRRLMYLMAHDHRDDDARSGAADTSDVVAEAWTRFLAENRFEDVTDRHQFRARLRQAIRDKAIDLKRREDVRRAQPLGHDSAEAPGREDVGFLIAEMHDLLGRLPLMLNDTALTLMECGNERGAAERLGISRHLLQDRKKQLRERLIAILPTDE